MVAAKEKAIRFKSGSSIQPVHNESAHPTATKQPSTVVNRISSCDFTARKFQKPPIGTSEKIHLIVHVGAHTKPRKYTGENVVQLRRLHRAPEMSLYRAYFVPGGVDPQGKRVCKCRKKSFGGGPHGGPTGDTTTYEYTSGSCSSLNDRETNGQSRWNKTCVEIKNPAPESYPQCVASCGSKPKRVKISANGYYLSPWKVKAYYECLQNCKHKYRNRLNQCPGSKPIPGVPDSRGNTWTNDASIGEWWFHGSLDCFRSGNFQCCYSCDGGVVTRGPFQGTYDYIKPFGPGGDKSGHYRVDVKPHLGADDEYFDDLTDVYE